ncbi:MAG: substrate-binding domain-containing protein [Pseudonocardiaceae bacterium]
MTGYLDVSTDIARRVRVGELESGAELWSVREHARRRGTTASTINRAYRCLAENKVIVLGDRRRARVATDGALAAARFLEPERVFRLAGSDDPALQIVLGQVGRHVVTVGARGSFQGVRALARGDADGAAIHLLHRNGTYNAPFARALLRGRGPTLIHLWRREQGLLVPRGNPAAITGPADLLGCRVAKREPGAGTRVLLDRLLTTAGIPPDEVPGPELGSHLEIALAVASGITDAGLGVRAAATDLDLDFVSLTWERYDIVLGAEALPAASSLISALRDPSVREEITALGGYDPTQAGAVEALTPS